MKKLLLYSSLLFYILNLYQVQHAKAQPGQWVWTHGSSTTSPAGVYGVQGVSSPTNVPAGIYEPCEFKDNSGNFWIYHRADLWKYDPLINQWTWIKGPGTTSYAGSYGVQGVPAPTNNPPSVSTGISSWTDLNGDFWILGGTYLGNPYSDLWRYTVATNEWTWMKGPGIGGQPGVYGTQGVPAPTNNPGARWEAVANWTDNANNLWLFGGYTGTGNGMNDLWRYSIATNEWTWMKGSQVPSQPGVYGTLGIENIANTPGARMSYARWKDLNGNLWLFGGFFYSTTTYNDMWRFNISTNSWAWMGGSSTGNVPGVYGTKCIASPANAPSSRYEDRTCWTDAMGNFWLFGGGTYAAGTVFNDLWMYCVSTQQWKWVSGDNSGNPIGNWGILGVPSPLNKPDGRFGSVGWLDNIGHLFVFGGGLGKNYNDMWKFTFDTACYNCAPLSVLAATASDSAICQNECISFIDVSSTNPTSWQWTFTGAQTPTSTLQNPANICYPNPGMFDVMLVACNGGGCDTLLIHNFISVDSIPAINLGADTLICAGDSITLNTGVGFDSYQWSNNATTQSITVSAQGTYYVEIISGACMASDTIQITTQACNFPVVAIASSDTLFCEKNCINFFDLSTNNPTSWQWYFPGVIPDTSTLQNPTGICYNTYGNYDVTLVACNGNGCDSLHLTNFITCFQNPVDSIYQSNDTLYSLPAFSYQWYEITSGIIAGAINQYYVLSQPGSYFCVVSDSVGCIASSNTVTITVLTTGPSPGGKGSVVIVPNPNVGSFAVYYPFAKYSFSVFQIFDLTGKKVFESILPKNSLQQNFDLSFLTDGVYQCSVLTDSERFNQKLVLIR